MPSMSQEMQKAHHSSVWRALRDSVSFSWQAICKQIFKILIQEFYE